MTFMVVVVIVSPHSRNEQPDIRQSAGLRSRELPRTHVLLRLQNTSDVINLWRTVRNIILRRTPSFSSGLLKMDCWQSVDGDPQCVV
jgi:hypothetical protein